MDGAGGFIPESPWVLREKGLFHEVPMFIGYTEHDAFITRTYGESNPVLFSCS